MAKLTEPEVLEELRNYDTPSITNVVATYPKNPLCLGLYNPWTENWYTDQSIRCMYPETGQARRLCGHMRVWTARSELLTFDLHGRH